MPLLLLVLIAGSVATALAFVAWHYPAPMASPTPTLTAAKAVGRQLGHHRNRLRRTITRRLNPGVATGLALTIALGVVAVGGFVIGALAYLVRTNSRLLELDTSVAQWSADHVGPKSERWLTLLTQLGSTWLVVVLSRSSSPLSVTDDSPTAGFQSFS